jgi:NAD+ synthase (glutamine-hydrolysing)
MKIALGQINTTVGAIEQNVARMLAFADKAKAAEADMIVFHELCVPGYPPKELASRRDFVSANLRARDQLKKESREMGIVCGHTVRGSDGRLYNAAVLLDKGEIALQHWKSILPSFTGYAEPLHFGAGQSLLVGDFDGVGAGLAISEDAWLDKDFWQEHPKKRFVPGRLVKKGARLLIVIASSPFWPGKAVEREKAAKALARRYRVPVIYVNQVGGNDSLIFDGGSFAVSADGRIIARAKRFEEDLVIADLDAKGEDPAREGCGMGILPMIHGLEARATPRTEDNVGDIRRALVLGVRDFVHKCGFEKAVLGLSGGIDSALVACIAVEALGRENVLALVMPSMYSSPESLRDAEVLARNLSIERRTISIEPIHNAYLKSLREEFKGLPADVTEENIQARIRGNLLMAFSNKLGHLVLATGNRSEVMTGYCTLYGDAAGGLAVIADVPKTTVYQLAERFNDERELIPRSVFEKAPSAELKPGQKDCDTLPPYDVLDPILSALLDEGKTPEEVTEMGYNAETVRDVVQRIYGSEHKRRQSPPALFVSKSALIPGRLRPLAGDFTATFEDAGGDACATTF